MEKSFESVVLEKLGEIIMVQAQHTSILNEHTRILNEHSKTLAEHSKILNEHSEILAEHSSDIKQIKQTVMALSFAVTDLDEIVNSKKKISH